MTTTIGDKIDRERTRRVIKHASHNQKDHGNRDGGSVNAGTVSKLLKGKFKRSEVGRSRIRGHTNKSAGFTVSQAGENAVKVEWEATEQVGSGEQFERWKAESSGKLASMAKALDDDGYRPEVVNLPNGNPSHIIVQKHQGPGDHKGGTPQSTHGRGARGSSTPTLEKETGKGGVTIRTMSGERPDTGFAVALAENELVVPKARATADRIGQYIRDNWDVLQKKGNFFGSWQDTEKGTVAFDVVKVFDADDYGQAFESAVKLGQRGNQDAIYDLTNEVPIFLNELDIESHRELLAA